MQRLKLCCGQIHLSVEPAVPHPDNAIDGHNGQNRFGEGKIDLKQDAYMGGDDRIVCDININLYKVGKNSYEGKKGKAKIKVKVYKNKIVIKQKGNTEGLYTDMSGTYKKMKK